MSEEKKEKPKFYKKTKAVSRKKKKATKEYALKVPLKVKGEIVNKIKLTKEGTDFFRSKNWI